MKYYTIIYVDLKNHSHEIYFEGTEEEVKAEAIRLTTMRPVPTRVYSPDGKYVGFACYDEFHYDDDYVEDDEWDAEPYDPFDEVGYNPYMGGFDPDC